ncbi:MAG TPA: MarR family transcriptional regulator [Acidimicrobiales bacterium]|nr:MarR family transcriptional regulator [Acidimicrobiales bacterium]
MAVPPSPASPPSPVEADVVGALRLGVMRLARRLRQQADGEVTPSLLSALASVERLGPVTLGDLAAAERVQPPTMTRLVGRLEELGFVDRRADDRDRRVARVALTGAGRSYIADSRRRKDAYLARRLERFTAEEREALARALPLLERLAGDEAPS